MYFVPNALQRSRKDKEDADEEESRGVGWVVCPYSCGHRGGDGVVQESYGFLDPWFGT